MVRLVAVPTWGDGLPVLARNVGCVEGWAEYVPRGVQALLVAPEHRVVGQPPHPSVFVGLANDEAHVGQHVNHSCRVCLRQDRHVSRKRRRPWCAGRLFLSALGCEPIVPCGLGVPPAVRRAPDCLAGALASRRTPVPEFCALAWGERAVGCWPFGKGEAEKMGRGTPPA